MQPNQREIRNVAMLDLTGAQAASALDGVTRITHVAAILVPESLLPRLSSIPMDNVAATVPLRDGQRVRVMSGTITLSGEALANAGDQSDDALVIAGQLVVTSPISRIGFADLIVLGEVIAPSGSETALGAGLSRLSGDLVYYPYVEGAALRVVGSQTSSGDALANVNGQPTDILLVTGQLVVTSPIQRLGYQQITAVGHLVVPASTEQEVIGHMASLKGQLVTYTAPPRVFHGKDHFSAGFFELLGEPITLVLEGRFSFDDDVAPELLRRSLGGIVLNGKIRAPRKLLPMLQVLCIAREGKIESLDVPE
jgi:hypothetical protein